MKTASKIYTALIMIFLFAPIAILLVFSFNASKSLSVFSGFSLNWYKELFKDTVMVPTDEADEFYQVMNKLVFIVLAFGPSFFSGNNLGFNCFIVYFLIRKNKKFHCIKRAKTESPVHRLCIGKICSASEKYINLEIPLSR